MKAFDINFRGYGPHVIADIPPLTPGVPDLQFWHKTESAMTAELLARFLRERMQVELHAIRRNAYLDGYNDRMVGREPRLIFSNEWPQS